MHDVGKKRDYGSRFRLTDPAFVVFSIFLHLLTSLTWVGRGLLRLLHQILWASLDWVGIRTVLRSRVFALKESYLRIDRVCNRRPDLRSGRGPEVAWVAGEE